MLVEQARNVVLVLLLGIALGLLIDIYRVIIRLARPKRVTLSIADVLFWLACGVGAFVYLLGTTSGEARLYIFATLLTGFLLEQKLLGDRLRPVMLHLARRVLKMCKSILGSVFDQVTFLLDMILAPVRLLVRLFLMPVRWASRLIKKLFSKIKAPLRMVRLVFKKWWQGEEKKDQ